MSMITYEVFLVKYVVCMIPIKADTSTPDNNLLYLQHKRTASLTFYQKTKSMVARFSLNRVMLDVGRRTALRNLC